MSHPSSNVRGEVKAAIEAALEGAEVEVTGGDGHYAIVVRSAAFEGKGLLQKQRLVYSAIAHLMKGDEAPVHAVDRLETILPA